LSGGMSGHHNEGVDWWCMDEADTDDPIESSYYRAAWNADAV